jgi:dinuclear metal center YbgI/SA1388 family protein
MVGDREKEITGVYLSLDADTFALGLAKELDCNVVLSHHPLIFDKLSSVTAEDTVYKYIKEDVAVISVHTPLDMTRGGVNDCLANACALEDITLFYEDGMPLGRIGKSKFDDVKDLGDHIKENLKLERYDYIENDLVKKVAVVSGSGGSLIKAASSLGCDTFVTGEAKHDALVLCDELGMNLILLGHLESENPVLKFLYKELSGLVPCHLSCRTKILNRR